MLDTTNRSETQAKIKLNKSAIIQAYNNGKSCREIEAIFGINRETIRMMLYRNGIQTRSFHASSKYSINSNYFNNIDEPEKAYWLGWLLSDGNVLEKNNRIALSLQIGDIEILHKFKASLQAENPVTIRSPNAASFINGRLIKTGPMCHFSFGNEQIKKDLARYGMLPRKSLTLKFPKIDEQLIPAFLRGFIEGDGYLSISTWKHGPIRFSLGLVSTKEFIDDAATHFSRLGLDLSIYQDKYFSNRNLNVWRASSSKNMDIVKCLDIIYKNHLGFFLSRKYNKYLAMKKAIIDNPS